MEWRTSLLPSFDHERPWGFEPGRVELRDHAEGLGAAGMKENTEKALRDLLDHLKAEHSIDQSCPFIEKMKRTLPLEPF
jgi:hypothetical protein